MTSNETQQDPSAILSEQFGFSEFREGQEEVIRTLLEGRSSLAVFPTGGGKSLCYQLPALAIDGLTLVISPLIALMEDQVTALKQRNIAAEKLDSSRSYDEIREIYSQARSGSLKLLYVAPERLANDGFVRFLHSVDIGLLAIDEAHCLSEWGHNFRPDYLKLPEFAKKLHVSRVLCLTATATPKVAIDIRDAFGIAEDDHIQTSFRRANLEVSITPCPADQRHSVLQSRLETHRGSSSIVYVTKQETAENVATVMAKNGLSARAYHAGLPPEVRTEIQEQFMAGEVDTVVATIAFGMGIDKSDIRAVYHFNLPKSIENYVQEIGRAGRDGRKSHCEMLACEDDRIVLENFIYGDTPSPQAIANALDHLLRQGDTFSISRYDLGLTCDMRPTVIATLLTYLEIEGAIIPTGPFYAGYKIEKLRELDRILDGHNAERQEFLRTIFQSGKEGWKWTTIDSEEAALAAGCDRSRVVKAIQWMEEHGDVRTQPAGLRHGYRLGEGISGADSTRIAKRLQELFLKREEQDVARIQSIIDLARLDGCLSNQIIQYFGEDPGDVGCGTCGTCVSDNNTTELPQSLPENLDEAATAIVAGVAAERHTALRTPRQLARFLSGIPSPAARRAKLSKHDDFGALNDFPFLAVLECAESQILT